MPCGLYADEAAARSRRSSAPGAQDARVWAVDAASSFSRPGPRLVDGVELLAHLLHPEPGRAGRARVPRGRPARPVGRPAPAAATGGRAPRRRSNRRRRRSQRDHRTYLERAPTAAAPLAAQRAEAGHPPATQAAEVAADRDVRHAEGEDQVDDHVEADLRRDVVQAAVPGFEEGRGHQPEDGTRGADGQILGREDQGAQRAAEQRDEEDRGETPGADRALQQGAQEVEGEHVDAEVDQAGVEEAAGDDPVVLALGDADGRPSRRTPKPSRP